VSIVSLKDWRDYPDGKEKRHLYYASREWAVLKEVVRERSGGNCERCRVAPGENVHHQTYERMYEERPEDLVHVCRPCHEFLSGRRDGDPATVEPPTLLSRVIKTVYLAGKMTVSPFNPFKNPPRSWRDEIVFGGWSEPAGGIGQESPGWGVKADCLPLPDGRTLDLSGPFWRHCGTTAAGAPAGPIGSHMCALLNKDAQGVPKYEDDYTHLAYLIEESIKRCDLFFAWIDRPDCFGTLVELGIARASDKVIVVAWPQSLDISELWLAAKMGWISGPCPSAKHAWDEIWTNKAHAKSIWD
jgi:hypothetical protein